jgi:pimeloyl-ACP methyl ester carboxylesterase
VPTIAIAHKERDMDIQPITTSDGVLLHMGHFAARDSTRPFLLCTHGVGNTFYTTPLWRVTQELAGLGYGIGVLNNRGHDWVTMNMLDSRWTGAAYERIEDAVHDLSAAIAWIEQQGHRRIVLIGHSLGGLKAAYMQAFHPSPAVIALGMCSSPRLPDDKVWDWSKHEAILKTARELIAAGRGDELMHVAMPTNTPAIKGLMCAATYVNKYGPEAATTTLRFADRIKVPIFLLAGSKEKPQLSFSHDRSMRPQ